MSSPWGNDVNLGSQIQTVKLSDIISAQRLQDHELKQKKMVENKKSHEAKTMISSIWSQGCNPTAENALSYSKVAAAMNTEKSEGESTSTNNKSGIAKHDEEWEDYTILLKESMEAFPEEVIELMQKEAADCGAADSDEIIAQMLQSQFDHEYNEELKRIERQRNKQSKIEVRMDKYRRNGDVEFLDDVSDKEECEEEQEETHKKGEASNNSSERNTRKMDAITKCGFKVDKGGEMLMSIPPEFATGDFAGFDVKLSNQVFNQMKTYSRRFGFEKKNKMNDRKENVATSEMGVDAPTRLLLYKLINNQILEQINGVISTGKEAVILHANTDPAYKDTADANGHGGGALLPPHLLPKECAIKIFKTTLNEFKQRDRYIKDDYRFKDRYNKQNNNRIVINMWAEKEMHNLMRMQNIGLNCPEVVALRKHVLVMSFIGENLIAAPKLKEAILNTSELSCAYEEIVKAMYKLYNEAKLVHADLSEYNILWYKGKCWFIDVAQSVEPEHPSALEFLMRDCTNIIQFFTKRGLPNIYTKEELFEYITALNAESHNAAMLERIHTRGASMKQATAPDQEDCPEALKPLEYPFEVAWAISQTKRQQRKVAASTSDKTSCPTATN